MTRYVIDASAAVEYLLKTAIGKSIAAATEHSVLVAPELMDAEVVAVLRRAVLREELSEDRALVALDDLSGWPVERVSHRALAKSAWRHRHNLTAYDAFYVATARAWGAELLTADGPLSRASRLDITVHNIRRAMLIPLRNSTTFCPCRIPTEKLDAVHGVRRRVGELALEYGELRREGRHHRRARNIVLNLMRRRERSRTERQERSGSQNNDRFR